MFLDTLVHKPTTLFPPYLKEIKRQKFMEEKHGLISSTDSLNAWSLLKILEKNHETKVRTCVNLTMR